MIFFTFFGIIDHVVTNQEVYMKIAAKVVFWLGVISLVVGIIVRWVGGPVFAGSVSLSASAFLRFSMVAFLMVIAMTGMFPYVIEKKE